MNIELKNIKICEFASEDTMCFQASLWIDGKKAADVGNDGQGGPNRFDFKDGELERRFYKHCRSLPKVSFDAGGGNMMELDNDEDLVVGALLERHQQRLWAGKVTAKALVFRLKTDESGSYRTIKLPGRKDEERKKREAGARAFIKKKYGDEIEEIVNDEVA